MRRNPVKLHSIGALVAVFILGACGAGEPLSTVPTTPPTTTLPLLTEGEKLDAARLLWESVGDSSYRYRFTDLCGECDPELKEPFEVAVYEGRMLPGDQRGFRISQLFDLIQLTMQSGSVVEVEYDELTGVPLDIKFDPQDFPIDGGTHYHIEDLVLGAPGDPITTESIDAALALWRERGFDSYQYDLEFICDCEEAGKFRIWITPDDKSMETISGNGEGLLILAFDELLDDMYNTAALDSLPDELGQAIDAEFLFRTHPDLGYVTWVWFHVTTSAEEIVGSDELEIIASISNVKKLEEPPPNSSDLKDLQMAKELWTQRGLANYSFELRFNCLCSEEYRGPFEITVVDGMISSATWNGDTVTQDVGLMTIEQAFEAIATAIEDRVSINVTYDDATGAPLRADLDLEAIAVDGGLSFSIDQLTGTNGTEDRSDLAAARELWIDAGLSDYVLSYGVFCPCEGDGWFTITVKYGDFFDTSMEHPDGTTSTATPEFRYTVDTLFDLIEAAISAPNASVDATYDEVLGYPVDTFIDWDFTIAGDEILIGKGHVEPIG